MSMKDYIAVIGGLLTLGVMWGMTNQKVLAMEKDMDRMEEALMMFTKIEVRIAVIETELKNMNKKLDR